ncbi:MAG: glutamine synthetase type III [Clostridiales bacterium]|nr:glutamine synthetase type III [Clostridiales bacterium]
MIPEIFGSMVFNDKVMQERLPNEVYLRIKECREENKALDTESAKIVATVLKEWAIEKGATHFTHWFQPMTGVTAEKHDSFIEPSNDGDVILKLSEKSLVSGETDASSFPSGGIRSTFEARGYTAWDPTSYAFVKDGSLYIPTAFCSYGGQSLDKKTPLLRSIQYIEKQAKRILKLFGNQNVNKVTPTVGAEQEYFLIDKSVYEKRLDLINSGRTLFGARPPKGQELEDHYYGAIKARVLDFMKELDEELWKLGVLSKTRHNEVAPSQHELAPIYIASNLASDQNQITMELMKSIAGKHGLVCLLHEKPFANVNGSGKHNNWSLSTDTGKNLLDPGETPEQNAQFLLVLCAVISAVDEHQDLLRISVSSAGNDHRLGGDEAPPAIISIYLGDELMGILEAIEEDRNYSRRAKCEVEIGVKGLPKLSKDSTDRNRTSPFAFTGNKFEFRMVGSSFNIACPNYILNTIVGAKFEEFADRLENSKDFNKDLNALIKETIKKHKRILFNGNNYSKEWEKEAKKRGLLNLKTTVEALPYYVKEENIEFFEKHKILSKEEMYSRYEILLENYSSIINIEAHTAVDMAKREILPSVLEYEKLLAEEMKDKKAEFPEAECKVEREMLIKISTLVDKLYDQIKVLEESLTKTKKKTALERGRYFERVVLKNMNDLRTTADELESMVGKKYWAFPTYEEILYSVKY